MRPQINLSTIVCVVFSIFLLINLHACSAVSDNPKQNGNQAKNNSATVSKADAVKIAKKFISSDYDIELYDALTYDKDKFWGIEFVFKEEYKHLTGGGAVVEINKKDGKIVNCYFAK